MKVYFDFNDWWIGYYRGDHHHYVCLIPTLVIRWGRHGGALRQLKRRWQRRGRGWMGAAHFILDGHQWWEDFDAFHCSCGAWGPN